MELNNNDDDNLGRNPLINNNNDNNNNDNNELNNIINNNNNNEQNNNFINQYSTFNLSFIFIFLINIIIYILSYFYRLEKYKFVFEMDSLIDHSQYYRFITRYFVHFGICHLLIELYITLYLCNYFENMFGTLMTVSFILIAMIINSIVQLCFNLLLSYLSNLLNVVDNTIINYEGGLTPVLFSLNTFFYLFEHDYLNEYNIFLFVLGKGKYSSFTILIILYFFTPNRTFVGNLSGIIGAYFIKGICMCFLPKIRWIIEFEDSFNLNKEGKFYRYITSKNSLMKNILNQIEPNSIRDNDIEIEKEEENNNNIQRINNNENSNEMHQSVIEMSSLSINNNNNNNNNNN